MNIIDFLIISCVFVILSYLPEDNICLFLVKPITMVCFVLFYYKKVSLIKKEHFIKCYSGHEPAHPNDSYNNPSKPWCEYTGVPDTKEKESERNFPSSIYNVMPYPNLEGDNKTNVNMMDRYTRSYREINENEKMVAHPQDHLNMVDNEITFEKEKLKYIDLQLPLDESMINNTNIAESVKKFSVLDQKIYDYSKNSKKYKISEMTLDIYKPVMRGSYIKEYYIDNSHSDTNNSIEGFDVCHPEVKNKLVSVNGFNTVYDEDSCEYEEIISEDEPHYHDRDTYSLKKDEHIANLVEGKHNLNDLTKLLIYFVDNDEDRHKMKDELVFKSFTKNLLLNNISVAVVNYNTPNDNRFDGKYYRINYIIQHFKKYSKEYGIDKNRIGVRGEGIAGIILYALTYYSEEKRKNIEKLLNHPIIPLRENPRPHLIILENPVLYLNQYDRLKYLNSLPYVDSTLQIYNNETKSKCDTQLMADLFIAEQKQLETENVNILVNELNILKNVNFNRSYTPLYVKNLKTIRSVPIPYDDLFHNLPFEAHDLYLKSKERGVVVGGNIPHFIINVDDETTDMVNFINLYL